MLIITQLISKIFPLLSTFFVFHFYSAEALGKFGLFTTAATIIAYITGLAYETSILSSKNPTQLNVSLVACFLLIASFSCLQFLLSYFFYTFFYSEPFILFIGLYTFLRSLSFVVQNLSIRFQYTETFAFLKIADSAFCNTTLIFFGWLNLGIFGLITSSFLSLLPSLLIPCILLRKRIPLSRSSFSTLLEFYKAHRDLPRFIASARFIENCSHHLHMLLFSWLFNIQTVGHLYIAQRILTAPIQLMELIAQFILKTLYHTHHLEHIIQKTSLIVITFLITGMILLPLLYVYLDPFICTYISADIVQIIEILLPLYLLTYLYQALIPFLIVKNKHKQVFCCYLGSLAIVFLVFLVGWLLDVGFIRTLLIFSFIKSIWLLSCVWMFLKMKQEKNLKNTSQHPMLLTPFIIDFPPPVKK